MTPAQQRMHAMLSDGRAVNMILTYQSRAARTRGYRLFIVGKDHRTMDVTSDICRIIGKEWDRTQGTYTTNEPYRAMDAPELAAKLTRALGYSVLVPILVM